MKIFVRLALYSVVLTAVAVILCCVLLLLATADNHIGSAIQSGVAELRMLNNSFAAEMDVVGDDQLSKTAKRSVILYVFRKYTDASVSGAHYILTDAEQTLYNDCPIDPRPLLPGLKENHEQAMETGIADKDAAFWPYTIAELDGRRYLAVGHWSAGLGDLVEFEHELFLVRDITGVYDGITALAIRFAVIALVTIIFCACLMVFVIRRVLRPLDGLQKSAAALAGGQYDNRIQVTGKDEISALAVSFNKMADAVAGHILALQETAEQRKLLLSALTHELKTPMTAIIGYSEALMRVRLNRAQKEESIAYINSECRRIERLSQKMMQLIALHGGEAANIEPQPVENLYEAVAMTLQGIARKENIELAFTKKGSPVFGLDIDMMASVLINLFDNARKAGAKRIAIAAEDGAISVRDDGAGIPQEEIEKITQPFYMVDKSHSRSEGGSGLGLALCELILKEHGARLHIESRVGEGTVVMIRFEKFTF